MSAFSAASARAATVAARKPARPDASARAREGRRGEEMTRTWVASRRHPVEKGHGAGAGSHRPRSCVYPQPDRGPGPGQRADPPLVPAVLNPTAH